MVSYKASAFTLLQLALPADSKGASRPKLRNSGNNATSLLSHIYNYFQEEPIFTPAISLEEFASVDSSKFQWVDPTEIQAGSSTCGYLNAPLGALPDVKYPTVKVCECWFDILFVFDKVNFVYHANVLMHSFRRVR